MRCPEVSVGAELAERMDAWAGQAWSLLEAWAPVSESMLTPIPDSAHAADVAVFERNCRESAAGVAALPGWLATSYVAAIGQHLAAIASMFDSRRVILSVWPLLRAQLELAGRVAWLLVPGSEAEPLPVRRRALRGLMERRLDWLRRAERESALGTPEHAGQARRHADAVRDEILKLDSGASIDWKGYRSLSGWSAGGDDYPQLKASAQSFGRDQLGDPFGLYELLSNLSHPSELELSGQVINRFSAGGRRRDFSIDPEVLEWQAKLACSIFYRAAQYVASYYGVDDGPLELWANNAPRDWFRETVA